MCFVDKLKIEIVNIRDIQYTTYNIQHTIYNIQYTMTEQIFDLENIVSIFLSNPLLNAIDIVKNTQYKRKEVVYDHDYGCGLCWLSLSETEREKIKEVIPEFDRDYYCGDDFRENLEIIRVFKELNGEEKPERYELRIQIASLKGGMKYYIHEYDGQETVHDDPNATVMACYETIAVDARLTAEQKIEILNVLIYIFKKDRTY